MKNIKRLTLSLAGLTILSSCSIFGGESTQGASSNTPTSTPSELTTLTLQRSNGYSLRFNNIKADYYLVRDNNDYRSEIRIEGDSSKTYFEYTPEVVGKHTVSIAAYNSSGKKIGFSNEVESVEIEPVVSYNPFTAYVGSTKSDMAAYGIPANLWNEAETKYGSMERHYFFIDKNGNWTIDGSLCGANSSGGYANISSEIDMSKEPYVSKIMKNLKDCGNNVLLLHNGYAKVEQYPTWSWWYKSDSDNCAMRFMDEAWKYGIKVIITDTALMATMERGRDAFTGDKNALKSEVQAVVEKRFKHSASSESNLMKFITHKAFYGINCPDEPFQDSTTMYAIGYASQKINELYETSTYKKLAKPIMFTCLNPYAPWLFSTEANYVKYIEQWLDLTQTNYVMYDMYNYETMSYGNNSNGYYCSHKIAFSAYQTVASKRPGLKVSQTINCGNVPDRNDIEKAGIFSCHLLSAANKYYGYGLFVFSPFDLAGTWENEAVDIHQERNAIYYAYQDANEQVAYLKNMLEGYSISSYNIKQLPNDGYGYGTKELSVSYVNGNNKKTMYINYETGYKSGTTSQYEITLKQGEKYMIFGENCKFVTKTQKENGTLKLAKGEGILVW